MFKHLNLRAFYNYPKGEKKEIIMACKFCKTNLQKDTLEIALLKLFNCNACSKSIEQKTGYGYLAFLSLQTRYNPEEVADAIEFACTAVGKQAVL